MFDGGSIYLILMCSDANINTPVVGNFVQSFLGRHRLADNSRLDPRIVTVAFGVDPNFD